MRDNLEKAPLEEAARQRVLCCVEMVLAFCSKVYRKAKQGQVVIDFM
jgi:hypothetical protein